MKLLIAERNEGMRLLIAGFVEDLADTVVECADGGDVVAAYESHRPDWVLMDVHLPTLDGIEATRRITAAFPSARVMIVTDYDDSRLRQRASSAGASAYVLKEDLGAVRMLLTATPPAT
jgi:DNA-binding NarL/FixJ family response regulator